MDAACTGLSISTRAFTENFTHRQLIQRFWLLLSLLKDILNYFIEHLIHFLIDCPFHTFIVLGVSQVPARLERPWGPRLWVTSGCGHWLYPLQTLE
jgi:hypothetical protein